MTDLGVVEVSDGIPIHRNLGNGQAWVITPTIVQGTNVMLAITLLVTNSTGSVQQMACPVIMSPAGHSMGVGDGRRFPGIRITPKIKL